jgi:hypothetical protein
LRGTFEKNGQQKAERQSVHGGHYIVKLKAEERR